VRYVVPLVPENVRSIFSTPVAETAQDAALTQEPFRLSSRIIVPEIRVAEFIARTCIDGKTVVPDVEILAIAVLVSDQAGTTIAKLPSYKPSMFVCTCAKLRACTGTANNDMAEIMTTATEQVFLMNIKKSPPYNNLPTLI